MKKPKQVWQAVVSIDPAKHAGVAAVVGGQLVFSSPAMGDKWATLYPVVSRAVASTGGAGPILCVIEEGWLAGFNMKGAMTLAKRRGIAQAAGEAAGIDQFVFIGPSTWQHALFPKGWKDAKHESLTYAQQYQPGIVDDNESDAICLALYTWKEYTSAIESARNTDKQ